MVFSIKTKIWNGSFLVFLLITSLTFGVMALADEQEAITSYLQDGDQDGLSAEEEKALGTDPTNSDTDGDGYSDGVEIESGYDPLKPAPGDRITPDATATSQMDENTNEGTVNLTDIASDELINLVQEKQSAEQEQDQILTPDDLNAVVAKVVQNANQEVELPEVDVDDIKVKEPAKGLSEEELQAEKKQDTLEYLTTVSYILMSNSPVTVHSKEDVSNVLLQASQNMMLVLSTGNFNGFNGIANVSDLKTKSNKALEEINALEVPENMIDMHVKAIQIVKLVVSMGETISAMNFDRDPIGQMAQLSKLQGAMFTIQNFLNNATSKMTDLGITNLPLDF